MSVGAGLYMYVVVQKFMFAISSPDEFLLDFPCTKDVINRMSPLKVVDNTST